MAASVNPATAYDQRRPPAFGAAAILALLTWVYVGLIVISSMAAPIEEFDDAIPLVHGVLVEQQAVPAIDFRSFYPPLGPYVTAAAFKLFGRTVIATRIVGGLLYVLVLVLLERLLARHFSRSSPRFAITLLLLAATLGKTIALPAWPGFGFALTALLVYFLSQAGGKSSKVTLALSGVIAGLALLYRVNFGAYVVLIVGLDLLMEYRPLAGANGQSGCWKEMLAAGAGFALPMLACVSVFCVAIYGNRLSAISQFTTTPQKIMVQRGFVSLEWSMRMGGAVLVPPVWYLLRLLSSDQRASWKLLFPFVLGIGTASAVLDAGNRVSVVALLLFCQLAGVIGFHFLVLPLGRLERAFLFFYTLQLHYYLSRADVMHFKFLPFAAVLLLPFIYLEPGRASSFVKSLFAHAMDVAALATLLGIFLWPGSKVALSNLRYGMDLIAESLKRPLTDSDRLLGSARPEAAWLYLYSSLDELRALRHLRQVTTNTDPIFVGVRNFSKVFVGNLRLYWLSGRPIGVREFQLEDGIATEPEVQREIIHDLDQRRVNWVIIDRNPLKGDKDFVKRAYSGSTLLDTFVSEHFKEESQFGPYEILRRTTPAMVNEADRSAR